MGSRGLGRGMNVFMLVRHGLGLFVQVQVFLGLAHHRLLPLTSTTYYTLRCAILQSHFSLSTVAAVEILETLLRNINVIQHPYPPPGSRLLYCEQWIQKVVF